MTREQLQHVIRAAADICGEPVFVIVGSQAIHGSIIDPDDVDLVRSMEADLYPLYAPGKSEQLNAIGLMSQFHDTFGIYADPVDEKTAVLPRGWEHRLIEISGPLTENRHGFRVRWLCLELHDLVISKLVANREKDIAFFRALVRNGRINRKTLLARLVETSAKVARRKLIAEQIDLMFESAGGSGT